MRLTDEYFCPRAAYMNADKECFTVPLPKIIHEMLGDEVVVINSDTGNYYSLIGSAARIWTLFGGGTLTPDEAAEFLARCYAASPKQLSAAICAFFAQLRAEGLIVPAGSATRRPALPEPAPTEKAEFVAPALQKYTDMQALLLLDPIHDMTQDGWPVKKPGN